MATASASQSLADHEIEERRWPRLMQPVLLDLLRKRYWSVLKSSPLRSIVCLCAGVMERVLSLGLFLVAIKTLFIAFRPVEITAKVGSILNGMGFSVQVTEYGLISAASGLLIVIGVLLFAAQKIRHAQIAVLQKRFSNQVLKDTDIVRRSDEKLFIDREMKSLDLLVRIGEILIFLCLVLALLSLLMPRIVLAFFPIAAVIVLFIVFNRRRRSGVNDKRRLATSSYLQSLDDKGVKLTPKLANKRREIVASLLETQGRDNMLKQSTNYIVAACTIALVIALTVSRPSAPPTSSIIDFVPIIIFALAVRQMMSYVTQLGSHVHDLHRNLVMVHNLDTSSDEEEEDRD